MSKIKLGDITKIRTGKLDANASSENGKYPFFTCSKDTLRIDSYSYDCECVLVAGNGDLNVKYYKGKFDAYQRTYIIEDNSDGRLYIPYLYYYLDLYVEELRKQSIGGVIKYIKLGNLTDAIINLPSIETQKEIVKILDKSRKIIENKNMQLEEYDKLIKSRFVEMFGDTKTNSKKLPLVKPEEICESISAGGDRPDEVSSIKTTDFAYPIFSNGEKDDGLYGWSKEYRIEKPSVTVSGRGTIGYSSYRKDGKFTPIVRLIVMTPNEKVNPVYLTYYLNLEREEGSGSGVQQLTVPMIKSKKIMLPELIKQNKFAEFVEQVDKLKFEVQKSLDESQMLFDSLMQEYFG